jgi:hypothetical protein
MVTVRDVGATARQATASPAGAAGVEDGIPSGMAEDREVMTWDDLGVAARSLAESVAADGYRPEMILAIARGGLLVGACLG